ncbi:MAG TPA: toxin-antitoxin system protein [Bdellovibrionota bacterium]|nr:toxin-antitoxin system protein [Bdellovibrionota bacterium]
MPKSHATTVRISPSARKTLEEISHHSGEDFVTVLDQALEDLKRKQFLERVNAAYGTAKKARKQQRNDAEVWDSTAADGLDPW